MLLEWLYIRVMNKLNLNYITFQYQYLQPIIIIIIRLYIAINELMALKTILNQSINNNNLIILYSVKYL